MALMNRYSEMANVSLFYFFSPNLSLISFYIIYLDACEILEDSCVCVCMHAFSRFIKVYGSSFFSFFLDFFSTSSLTLKWSSSSAVEGGQGRNEILTRPKTSSFKQSKGKAEGREGEEVYLHLHNMNRLETFLDRSKKREPLFLLFFKIQDHKKGEKEINRGKALEGQKDWVSSFQLPFLLFFFSLLFRLLSAQIHFMSRHCWLVC